MTGKLNITVAQSPADLNGPRVRLAWLRDCLSRLEGQQTDLLVLPELFLTGYNIGSRVSDWAETADGPSARAIAEFARAHRVAIHYGFAEREGGRLFNSASCIGKDGSLLSTTASCCCRPALKAIISVPARPTPCLSWRVSRPRR